MGPAWLFLKVEKGKKDLILWEDGFQKGEDLFPLEELGDKVERN